MDRDQDKILEKILDALQQLLGIDSGNQQLLMTEVAEQLASKQLLQQIVDNTNPKPVYTVRLTQLRSSTMALGTLTPGGTGQFGAVLLNNGVPDTSSFVPSFTFTTSDASATVAPATTDASGGTIALQNQSVVSIPAGDTSTTITVTATATDPNGVSQSGTSTVAVGGGTTTAVYTIGVTQLA
jgi:hypothetical protein